LPLHAPTQQAVPQAFSPLGQVHREPAQTFCSPVQACPQLPQLSTSDVMSTQSSPQTVPASVQSHLLALHEAPGGHT
jgi:hypothetical protein